MVLFLVDEVLNIIYKGKAFSLKLKDIILEGNIIDRVKFMEEFAKFLKREKVKGKLFGDNITVVKNASYNNRDLYFIESIFLELGFNKVEFMDILSLLPEREGTFIEINNGYMVLYLNSPLLVDLKYIKDIPRVLNYFKEYFKGDVILFGTNQNIPSVMQPNINLYYLENFNSYITDSLLKVKKCDA